jgi:hypothetical protein
MKSVHHSLIRLSFNTVGRKRDLVKTNLNHETDTLWRQKLTIGGKANEWNLVRLAERHEGRVALIYRRLGGAADVKAATLVERTCPRDGGFRCRKISLRGFAVAIHRH